MSPTVESAVAPAALDMEALQRKLIELRGEIDAILLQLAAPARPTAAERAAPAVEEPAQERSATPATAEAAPTETTAHEATVAPEAAGEKAERDLDAPERADAPDETERAEPSLDVMPAIEKPAATLTAALAACEVVTRDEAAAAASIDAEVTSRGPASPVTEDVVPADTTAEGPRGDAEPKLDATASAGAAAIEASLPPASASDVAIAAEEPLPVAVEVAAAAPAAVAAEPGAAPAEATTPASQTPAAPAAAVISFEPRQRKEKADLAAPRPVAASRGRRVAGRIAAGIVALIAAAGALVLADREAFGGPRALPWVSPLPSYPMPWSFLGQQKRAEGAAGTGASAVGGMAASEALLARYREVWPVSP